MSYIERLKEAIKDLHGTESEHLESVPVTEIFQGEIVWEGTVEVFLLKDHPVAKRAYAWSHPESDDSGTERFIAVLDKPPITSPQTAVKAAIVGLSKKGAKPLG